MKLRLASWNMAHWSHKQFEAEAWGYFSKELDCDILLFQESSPNLEILNADQLVWNAIGGTRSWGSGVYSENHKIKELAFENNFFGAVTAVEIGLQSSLNLVVISVYGLMEEIQNVTYAIPNLHRIFSDLTGLLEGQGTRHRIVLGGDLNASKQIDEQQVGNSHQVFFERLREFGLVNCFDNYFDTFVQTHRHCQSDEPWQNDHFFISKKLEGHLVDCWVVDNEKVRRFSDHNPVVIEMEI